MDESLVDYTRLGKWTGEIPAHCAHPTRPHALVEGAMISGWADCACGGHRTVRCIVYEGGRRCDAVHHIPALTGICSLRAIPRQRRHPGA
ncbi:MAG TPA: hypothetical protein VGH99_06940 [Pseudonocardia sp.]|jgi:hypothetical protein